MARIDYNVNDENDLIINAVANDFEKVPSDKFHVRNIMYSDLGHFHWSPLLGASALSDLNGSSNLLNLRRKISEQLEADGYRLDEVKVENNDINVLAQLL
jgi:hypothetical protein